VRRIWAASIGLKFRKLAKFVPKELDLGAVRTQRKRIVGKVKETWGSL
jgi:hypothetical protein